jgi:hypothetical protein
VIERPTTAELAEAIEWPADGHRWRGHCHEVSIAIVKARVFPVARVARGGGGNIPSQHSWVVLGDDVYDEDAVICDPTMFPDVWYGTLRDGLHTPHGSGQIWAFGRPQTAEEEGAEPYRPSGYDELSDHARTFLELLGGELSLRGWHELAHYPVQGWPSKEIITMICEDTKLRAVVPIDIEGMVTDRNPQGLYLPDHPS